MPIIKFRCNLTLEIVSSAIPQNDIGWERFNTVLEARVEEVLEQFEFIETAEIIIEEC